MKLEGLKELEAKLRKLGQKDGSRAIRTALLAAGEVLLKQARQNAAQLPTGSGAYAESLGVRYVREGSDDVPVGRRFLAKVGPRVRDPRALGLYNVAYNRKARGIFYGHLVERGFTHVGGKQISGRYVLRRALEQKQSEAVATFRKVIGEQIERLVKKQARGTARAKLGRLARRARPITRRAKRAAKSIRRATKRANRSITRFAKRARKAVTRRPTRRRR